MSLSSLSDILRQNIAAKVSKINVVVLESILFLNNNYTSGVAKKSKCPVASLTKFVTVQDLS